MVCYIVYEISGVLAVEFTVRIIGVFADRDEAQTHVANALHGRKRKITQSQYFPSRKPNVFSDSSFPAGLKQDIKPNSEVVKYEPTEVNESGRVSDK